MSYPGPGAQPTALFVDGAPVSTTNPLPISGSGSSTVLLTVETAARIVRARYVLNPTLSATVNWQYVNQSTSSVEYATPTGITITGGTQVGAFAAATNQTLPLDTLDLRLEPGDVLAVALQTASSTATADVSLNWHEE